MAAWLLASLLGARVAASIMNQGGVPYAISNPPGSSPGWHGTPGTYSTDFETNVAGEVEHFDVYGEVQTLYSQVRCTLYGVCRNIFYQIQILSYYPLTQYN